MKSLDRIPELLRLAPGIVWFETPTSALRDPVRFLVYAMTYATPRELAVLRKHISDQDFKAALKAAAPGIMDKRSWAYWHAMFGNAPPPPLPKRNLRRSAPRPA